MSDKSTDDEFERQLAEGQQAAEALRQRLQADPGDPGSPRGAPGALRPDLTGPPRKLADELHLTVPPPAALQRAVEYWAAQGDERTRADARAEANRRLARARAVEAKLPPRFAWAKFDDPLLAQRVLNAAVIEEARQAIEEPKVVLTGGAGAGKTSLAAAMIRARFVAHGGPLAMEPAWEIASARSRFPLGQGEPPLVTKAIEAEILVIDDLGLEKPDPRTAVDDVINGRYWNARATWFTTSKTPKEIKERYGDGIARRVFQDAVIIDCAAGRATK